MNVNKQLLIIDEQLAYLLTVLLYKTVYI